MNKDRAIKQESREEKMRIALLVIAEEIALHHACGISSVTRSDLKRWSERLFLLDKEVSPPAKAGRIEKD